jgi:hypothetical protein
MENKSKFVNIKINRTIAEEMLETYKDFLHFNNHGPDRKEIKKVISSIKKALE